jgi:DNA-binding CsgD family transcriptional regulator
MPPKNTNLTNREIQVLALRNEHKNGKQIAKTLHIAYGTVRNYDTDIRAKFGLKIGVK